MSDSSNQETQLIEQLSSEKRSVVIQAIVKLARTASSVEATKAVASLVSSSDSELSFFAAQAAAKIAKKTGYDFKKLIEETYPTEDGSKLTSSELLFPEKAKVPFLLESVRKNIDNLSDNILPAVGVFIEKHGDITDSQFIFDQLQSQKSNLVIPFINAAHSIAPEVLQKALPNLLASEAPLVRSMAVSALRKIDPVEAERHFSDQLASKDPEDRLAAINIAFQFPFERASRYILSILSYENDAEVLRACQIVLASNPSFDIAFSILDSMDLAEDEHKSRLSIILKTVCRSLVAAGITDEKSAQPEEIIEQWKHKRLSRFIENLELELSFADEQRKKTIYDWLNKNSQHQLVQKLVKKLSLESLIQSDESLDKKQNEKQATDDKKAKTIEEQDEQIIQKIASINIDNYLEHIKWLQKKALESSPIVRIEAMNALFRFYPDKKLKEIAREALKSDTYDLRLEGFKILEKADQMYLKKVLPSLLTDSDEKIRSIVMDFALEHDTKLVITILEKLVQSKDSTVRSNALSCLGACPFDDVLEILLNRLDTEENPVLVRHVTSILLNNPSYEVLKSMEAIHRTSNAAVEMVISQARNELLEILLTKDKSSVVNEEVEDSDKKPYSLSNVKSIARKTRSQGSGKSWKPAYKAGRVDKSQQKVPVNYSIVAPAAVICIVLLAVVTIVYFQDGSKPVVPEPKDYTPTEWRATESVKQRPDVIPDIFRMNYPCNLDVKVTRIISDSTIVVEYRSDQMMINFEVPHGREIQEGFNINVTVVPYRINPNGVIMAAGRAINKVTEK